MTSPRLPLYALILGFLSLAPTGLVAQQAAPATSAPTPSTGSRTPVEEAEELDWMVDGLHLAAEGIGIETSDLFTALMHDLSIAEVAKAHGVLPLDLFDLALSLEESEILDDMLEEEISREEASEWREVAAEDVAWMLYEKDPFGLADVAWVLDGASLALNLDMLELVGWLDEGVSLDRIAVEMEIDPLEVADAAETFLRMEVDTLLLLEQIDAEEAESWMSWSLEWLPELLEDEALFETLAEDAWMEEIVALLAGMLVLEEETLWEHLEEGSRIVDLFQAYEVDLAASAADWGVEPEVVREMIAELEAWLDEDPGTVDPKDDRADF